MISVGSRVRILYGSFIGQELRVVDVDGPKVIVDLPGQGRSVHLAYHLSEVEPVEPSIERDEIETHPARVRWYEAGRLAGVAEGLERAAAYLEKHAGVVDPIRFLAADLRRMAHE